MNKLYGFTVGAFLLLGAQVHASALPEAAATESTAVMAGNVAVAAESAAAVENAEILGQQLLEAVKIGDVEMVKELIAQGASVNVRTEDRPTGPRGNGMTPLMIAARLGSRDMVAVLLEAGAHTNAIRYGFGFEGSTALMEACIYGRLEVVRLLLTAGADVNVTAPGEEASLSRTLYQVMSLGDRKADKRNQSIDDYVEIIKLLLNASAAVDYEYYQNSALMAAARHRLSGVELNGEAKSKFYDGAVEMLLTAGASVDLQNSNGETALMTALLNRNSARVRMLVLAGADLSTLKYHNGQYTALRLAEEIGLQDVIDKAQEEKDAYLQKHCRGVLSLALEELMSRDVSNLVKEYDNECAFLDQRSRALAERRRALRVQVRPSLQDIDPVADLVIDYISDMSSDVPTEASEAEVQEKEDQEDNK